MASAASYVEGSPLHQASAAFDRFRLRPRLMCDDTAGYVYVWVTDGHGGDPHGNWLPHDWFSEIETPIPNAREETAVVEAAVAGFARLPADRRRGLAGF